MTNKTETTGRLKNLSTLRNNLAKKLQGIGSTKPATTMQPVVENEEDDDQ